MIYFLIYFNGVLNFYMGTENFHFHIPFFIQISKLISASISMHAYTNWHWNLPIQIQSKIYIRNQPTHLLYTYVFMYT